MAITENKSPDTSSDTPASMEKGNVGGRTASVGDGTVPYNLREADFMTRNGLNMKSFQRRELVDHLRMQRLTNNR